MNSEEWHQVIVNDPKCLSGESVASFVRPITRKLAATSVVVSDLVGASPGLSGLEKQVLSVSDFLSRVANATQYDWAFFFVYSRIPTQEESAVADEKATIKMADATIRLADDQYFYVYSRNIDLISDLRRMYQDAEYKNSRFEELDIPY